MGLALPCQYCKPAERAALQPEIERRANDHDIKHGYAQPSVAS